MKHFEKFRIYEDADIDDEIWPKSKPTMKFNAIRAAVFCVVLVIFVGGIIGWLMQ